MNNINNNCKYDRKKKQKIKNKILLSLLSIIAIICIDTFWDILTLIEDFVLSINNLS